jgi:menaquinone-9 beta-reductase
LAATNVADLETAVSLAPTLSLDAATERLWDAVVIGAGPAGALAARQLAITGRRILLVDRKAFPRTKVCGACVNNEALAILQTVGLLPAITSLAGVPLENMQIRDHSRTVRLPLPGGLAVSRMAFDAALVQAAIEAGAAFLPQTTAELAPMGAPDSRPVILKSSDQAPVTVEARIVLAADGLGHPSLQRCGEFTSHVDERARIGLGATIPDGTPVCPPGTVLMAIGAGGYVGLVQTETGELNVAAAVDSAYLNESGGSAAAVQQILDDAQMSGVPPLSNAAWQGTMPLTRRTWPVAGERVFVLGDAAGYVEPFTGQGIAWALSSALAVIPLAQRGMTAWTPRLAVEWSEFHRRQIGRRQRWCRWLAGGLRSPIAVRSVLSLLSLVPALAEPLVRHVCGSSACLETE